MFTLPPLPYSFDALEPYIDTATMELHYTKHHQGYIDKLNKALAGYPAWQNKRLEYILTHLSELPSEIRKEVADNAGGHYNHSFFWPLMAKPTGIKPNGLLLQDITKTFGAFEIFQTQFNEAAKKVFGSGWAWLVMDKERKLSIITTPNQDTPICQALHPLLGLDVWEHAYYLKYQNRRPDYITAWWHVVNWEYAQEQYNNALAR